MNSRRRARFVSEVDRRLIQKGLAPSWKDHVTEADRMAGLGAPDPEDTAAPEMGEAKNDEVLKENVPPHWQARL